MKYLGSNRIGKRVQTELYGIVEFVDPSEHNIVVMRVDKWMNSSKKSFDKAKQSLSEYSAIKFEDGSVWPIRTKGSKWMIGTLKHLVAQPTVDKNAVTQLLEYPKTDAIYGIGEIKDNSSETTAVIIGVVEEVIPESADAEVEIEVFDTIKDTKPVEEKPIVSGTDYKELYEKEKSKRTELETILVNISPDYSFTVLGFDIKVNGLPSEKEIKTNFKKLSMKAHPDRGGSDEEMAILNIAHKSSIKTVKDLKASMDRTDEAMKQFEELNRFNERFR